MLSAVPDDVLKTAASLLPAVTKFENYTPASGGCINSGGTLITSSGHFFLKWNSRQTYPDMFQREAKGLALLHETNSICVPEVIGAGEGEIHQWLLLEYLEQNAVCRNYWEALGASLASLHRHHNDFVGLDHDNYIGSLRQVNSQDTSWIKFFTELRLRPLLIKAVKEGKAPGSWIKDSEKLFSKLPDLLPFEKSSLLHGDLWRGNVITNHRGEPCLIDPAVYYGHREMDIAMTKLFGGFDHAFYVSYNDAYPLTSGFNERHDIYNLYPLLVHLNLFGAAYEPDIRAILKRYS